MKKNTRRLLSALMALLLMLTEALGKVRLVHLQALHALVALYVFSNAIENGHVLGGPFDLLFALRGEGCVFDEGCHNESPQKSCAMG